MLEVHSARIVTTGPVECSKLHLLDMARVNLFPRHNRVYKLLRRLLTPRELLAILVELGVPVEEGIQYTCILHIGQISPPKTAFALILVARPSPNHVNKL